jgi:septal ring factor EnvC (AmiA/AmiB activator)
VRAVAAGTVVLAEPLGTYGLTVIVQHGGGRLLDLRSLARADVRKGAAVAKGQTVGAVGRADPDLPPHLHFRGAAERTRVDPLTWLRARRWSRAPGPVRAPRVRLRGGGRWLGNGM